MTSSFYGKNTKIDYHYICVIFILIPENQRFSDVFKGYKKRQLA